MKKRLKGLLCLWLAALVAAVPAVRATAEGGSGYLFVYTGDSELANMDIVANDDKESKNVEFVFNEKISAQSAIMDAVAAPSGTELDSWRVWQYVSGYVHSDYNSDNQPDTWAKDHIITTEEYETYTMGDPARYILLQPVFRKKSYNITLPNVPGCTVTPAAGSVSPVEHGDSFTFNVIMADGYEASDNFTVSANGTALTAETNGTVFTYTIENITEAQEITVTGITDKLAPEVRLTLAGGQYWEKLHQGFSVFQYFKGTQTVTVTAADEGSGLKTGNIWYCIADQDLFLGKDLNALTEDEKDAVIMAAGGWSSYTDPIVLEDDRKYVVYAKAQDAVNNTNYANTAAFVIDTAAPELWNETVGNGLDGIQYKGNLTVSVEDENLDYVTVDGERVELTGNTFTITADCRRHTIVARDKAGNETKSTVYVFDEYEISKAAAEGGSFTVTGEDVEVTVAEPNTEIVVTASADEGYSIDGIVVTKTGDENTQVTVTDGRFTMPSYPVTVTVTFSKKTYEITLPNGEGFTAAPASGLTSLAEHGSDYTFTVAVANGYGTSGNFAVSANGNALEPASVSGNVYTYIIENVTEATEITVTGVADTEAPELRIMLAGGEYWDNLHQGVSIFRYFNEAQTVTLAAADGGSGLKDGDIWYCIADRDLFAGRDLRTLTDGEKEAVIAAAGGWVPYTDPVVLEEDAAYVIYAKAGDKADNVIYANTEAFVIDTVSPVIRSEAAGNELDGIRYRGNLTFSVEDDNLDYVTVDGERVELAENEYTVEADCRQHVIAAWDKAGNKTEITVYVYDEYEIILPNGAGFTAAPASGESSVAAHGSDYTFTVAIADGYKTSDNFAVTANGRTLTPAAVDGNVYTYTIENITEVQQVTVEGIVSAAAPAITVTVENESAQWEDFWPAISFDYFFNKTIAIDVAATEADSGTKLSAVWYYLAGGDLFSEDREYTAQEIEEAVSGWTDYTDALTLSADGKYVLYLKAEDSNGNVAYVNTAGIVIDTVVPTVFGVENGGVYYGDTLIRASDDNLDTVTVDGTKVQLTDGAYTIAADNQMHTVTVRDKAGNQISYELYTFETWVRDGIQAGGARSLTAGTAYRLGSGQWKVSGDETVYEGGSSFYVAESGSYVFSQQ